MAEANGERRKTGGRSPRQSKATDAAMRLPDDYPQSSPDADQPPEPTGPEAIPELLRQVMELREYGEHYLSARIDSVKQSVREIALRTVLGIFGLISVAVALGAGIVVFVMGLAEGFTTLFGDRVWLGRLTAGSLVLAGIAGAIYFAVRRVRSAFMERMAAKYEKRKAQQQERFGHDAADIAASAGK